MTDNGRRTTLCELGVLFLKLGATAFGGPAAHIGMMEDEVVRRRRWLTRDEFLDLVGATNLIPGPNSTELAIHIGYARAGWAGLLVAGTCFIVPAMAIVLALAWAYVRYGRLPAAEGVLYGVKSVVIAVVVQALAGLGRAAVKSRALGIAGVAAVAASAAGVHELVVLFGVGLGIGLVGWASDRGSGRPAASCFIPLGSALTGAGAGAGAGAVAAAGTAFGLGPLFLFFLKVGSVLFGSGYVLLAFLRADVVTRWGWLTEGQLIDAVAVGQVTPGPLFTTATFIGYVLGGLPGGLVATLGIFLPAFVFVAASGPLVPRLRRSRVAGAFLDGVNVASLALMAEVTWQLGRAALVDFSTVAIALISALLLIRFRVTSAWLVLGGAALGVLTRL
jgi:chromate transporter